MKRVCVEWASMLEKGVIAGRHGKKYIYPLSALTLSPEHMHSVEGP